MTQFGRVVEEVRGAARRAVRKLFFKEEPTLFVAAFKVQAPPAVLGALVAKFDNLSRVLVEPRGAWNMLLTFWKDEASFVDVAAEFKQAAGLSDDPVWRRLTTGADPPRWRVDWAKTIWNLVLFLVACFGFTREWAFGLVAAPDVTMPSDNTPVEPSARAGQPFSLTFDLTNNHESQPCDVTFGDVWAERISGGPAEKCPVRVLNSLDRLANLKPGAGSRKVSAQIDQPGTYRVHLPGTATAGAFRGRLPREAYRVIHVSPETFAVLPAPKLKRIATAAAKGTHVCEILFELETGQDIPRGLSPAVAYLTPATGVHFAQVLPWGGGSPIHVGAGDAELARIDWKVPPMAKNTKQQFELSLYSEAAQAPDWNAVAARIKFRLTEAEK